MSIFRQLAKIKNVNVIINNPVFNNETTKATMLLFTLFLLPINLVCHKNYAKTCALKCKTYIFHFCSPKSSPTLHDSFIY